MTDRNLTIDDVINAYRCGLFPMADSRDSEEFYWYDPPMRGQISIEKLRIPERLRRTVLQFPYDIRVDTDFASVIDGCAESAPDRPQTWINKAIRELFIDLHGRGYGHSVEAWQGDCLVGGLYGLAIGGAFMGESMFSRADDASKICLVHLCARLWQGGFTVLDTQFINDHLMQFGAYEVPKEDYLEKLRHALAIDTDFLDEKLDEKVFVASYLAHNL